MKHWREGTRRVEGSAGTHTLAALRVRIPGRTTLDWRDVSVPSPEPYYKDLLHHSAELDPQWAITRSVELADEFSRAIYDWPRGGYATTVILPDESMVEFSGKIVIGPSAAEIAASSTLSRT